MLKILEWKTYGKSGFDMFSITESEFEVTFENLVGQKFNKLTVLEKANKMSGTHFI